MSKQYTHNINYKTTVKSLNDIFRAKFKLALKRRNVTQQQLAKILNVTQAAVSRWSHKDENKQNKINMFDFLFVCKYLQLDPNYFFYDDMSFEEADLLINSRAKLQLINQSENVKFVETSVSRMLFLIFEECRCNPGVYIVNTVAKNGTTTSIREYVSHNKNSIYLKGKKSLQYYIDYLSDIYNIPNPDLENFLSRNNILLIFDNADKFDKEVLDDIIKYFNYQFELPILFIGKHLKKLFEEFSLERRLDGFFSLLPMNTEDIKALVRSMEPGVKESEFTAYFPILKRMLRENIFQLRNMI